MKIYSLLSSAGQKLPRYFAMFKIVRVISKLLFIYSTISRETPNDVLRNPHGTVKSRINSFISWNEMGMWAKQSGAFVQPLLHWKSDTYYIFWVCVCSLSNPGCNAHAPYFHLWPCHTLQYIFHVIS